MKTYDGAGLASRSQHRVIALLIRMAVFAAVAAFAYRSGFEAGVKACMGVSR